jgi:hypothetical protein
LCGSAQRIYNEDLTQLELVEFRDTSLPGYELESRGIELGRDSKLAVAAKN